VAAGWGDSNSGPPRKVLLGRGGAAKLTCGSIWLERPLVPVALPYLPAFCVPSVYRVYRWSLDRLVADASGVGVGRSRDLRSD
jgi:hypothetical protein